MSQSFNRFQAFLTFIVVFAISLAAQYFYFNAEKYQANSEINLKFPIAALNAGVPAIVEWHEYSKNKDQFRGKLIANASIGVFSASNGRTFTLTPLKEGSVVVEVRDHFDRWYAEYVVESELARPIALHRLNVAMAGLAFLLASIGAFVSVFLQMRRSKP